MFQEYQGRWYFVTEYGLNSTDGTRTGTRLVKSFARYSAELRLE